MKDTDRVEYFRSEPCDNKDCQAVETQIFRGVSHILGVDGLPAKNRASVLCIDQVREKSYQKEIIRRQKRNYKKAEEMGCYFSRFDYRTYIEDIVAINISKDFRSGGNLKDHYKLGVEQRGGFPKSFVNPVNPPCMLHNRNQFYGVFINSEVRISGGASLTNTLLAYNGIAILDEMAIYSWNIGHGDWLKHGVMSMLTVGLVNYLKDFYPHVRYLVQGNWTDGLGIGPGLQQHKKELLFEPVYLCKKVKVSP